MDDGGLRDFTEMKAFQHLDAVIPCVIDTGLSFSFIRVGAPCQIFFLSFPTPGPILRPVGPSLRFCRIIFDLECLRHVVLHSRVISPRQPPSMVLEVYVLARWKFQDPRDNFQGYLACRPILMLSCTDWNWFDGKGHSVLFKRVRRYFVDIRLQLHVYLMEVIRVRDLALRGLISECEAINMADSSW